MTETDENGTAAVDGTGSKGDSAAARKPRGAAAPDTAPDAAPDAGPDAAPEAEPDGEAPDLAAELEAARRDLLRLAQERDEARDRALRLAAEAENTRRRLERDKADAVQYAATAFARDMLSVADNLERALLALRKLKETDDAALSALLTGIEMTHRELLHVFERHGIRRIETEGLPLDPNRHQAMVEVEADSAPGTVVSELQAGWMIKDRLLRPALVAVARAREEAGT
jgi:Molecular chaperone GrpE (heat shock protein)